MNTYIYEKICQKLITHFSLILPSTTLHQILQRDLMNKVLVKAGLRIRAVLRPGAVYGSGGSE